MSIFNNSNQDQPEETKPAEDTKPTTSGDETKPVATPANS